MLLKKTRIITELPPAGNEKLELRPIDKSRHIVLILQNTSNSVGFYN